MKILISGLLGAVVILAGSLSIPGVVQGDDFGQPEIAHEFNHKIVYTVRPDTEIGALNDDCSYRGGTFNACGSICDHQTPAGTECVDQCAPECVFSVKGDE